ncbi:methyltransferase domain-containing protein [Vineibacter terrae]|uniref:Methyltransferase domain-containing protein n=1 Tax=Vineibacter terrae TaxID=2586908 RepID=A0A5C8PJ11_9HYPH|nr:methyltransferase domain-containing protein [Vineibacter terrae]TXL73802.1 methyltransferase domain-containing protein [Vineibacter terrae]
MAAPDPMLVFDRDVVRRRRERAAASWDGAAFLKREVAQRLVERLDDVRRRFPLTLDIGCHGGEVAAALRLADGTMRGGVETLVSSDLALGFARRAAAHGPALVADEEALPLRPASVDLVLSALALHWVNDLPGALVQVGRTLKPDGLFLAALLGGETLWQLRRALAQAESDVEGGLSPRVSPFADLRDAAGLLQRAGFAMPVADAETIDVRYPDALALMRDLRAMAESNAVRGRRSSLARRETLARAAAIYAQQHGGGDGRVAATFEVLYLHGWAPHAGQPQPLRPGTAAARLADALGTTERPAGEKAGR